VVRVRDLFSVGESLGLVMDLVPGGSLRDHLREHHTVPAAEAARLAAQVAAALAEAHELGVIHRDLKPDNILLQETRGRLETRLTDFGIARVLNTPSLTTPNAVVGTPHYMSPEAFHGTTASPAADVYALGILLYEMVCGRPPYHSDSVPDLMRRHLQGDPERRPGIPDPLWAVIMSCLAHKPRLRPSAAELVAELTEVSRAVADAPALPRPEQPPVAEPSIQRSVIPAPRAPRRRNQAPSWRWARPGTVFAVLAATMLASGVATTAWHMTRAAQGSPRQVVVAAPPSSRPPASPAPPAATTRPPVPRSATARPRATSAALPEPRRTPSAGPARPTRRAPTPEARPYGDWVCERRIVVDFRNPLMARPCRNTGPRVQVKAALVAPGGGTATVTVSLRSGGRTVAGPYTCSDLTFSGDMSTRECGPRASTARKGQTYTVGMTWAYVRNGRTVRGSVEGSAFTF
jgi:hypothetical protein